MARPGAKPPLIGAKAPYPGFVEPALASSIAKVPAGDRWIHEVKFDGYRVQVHLANEAVKVFTRRGNDWTGRFKKIADDAWRIAAGSAVIDGEVIVPSETGVSISRFSRTNCAASPTNSCSTLSICFISTVSICERLPCSSARLYCAG